LGKGLVLFVVLARFYILVNNEVLSYGHSSFDRKNIVEACTVCIYSLNNEDANTDMYKLHVHLRFDSRQMLRLKAKY